MHAQIRTRPAKSPADLAAFLQVLEDAGINMEAAGGSNLEHGGEFAFALQHADGDNGPYDVAMAELSKEYKPRYVEAEIHACALENKPGELLRCIREAIQLNEGTGRKIRDVSVGATDAEGRIQVQVYSEGLAEEAPAS